MKFNKQLPVYILMASFFIACNKDDQNNNGTNTNTSPQCSIKITSTDAPVVNDKFILIEANTDNVNVDSIININGSDKTWDFSDLASGGYEDTLFFEAASAGFNSAYFPNADFVFSDDEEMYIKINSTGLDVIGATTEEEGIEVSVTNPMSFIPYSLEMGKTFIDEFDLSAYQKDTIDTTIVGLPPLVAQPILISITQTNSNTFNVDGCGKITTPYGEYDCLRYTVEAGEADITGTITGNYSGADFTLPIPAADLDDAEADFNLYENKTYVWISKATKFPVVIVSTDENGDIESVEYLKD